MLCFQGQNNVFQTLALLVYYIQTKLDTRVGPTIIEDPALRGLHRVISGESSHL